VNEIAKMALLRWLKPENGLPDPRGSLSSSIPSQAIAAANQEVEEAIHTTSSGETGSIRQSDCSGQNWQVRLPSDFMMNLVTTNAPVIFHSPPCFLDMLNFRRRSIAQKIYSMKYFYVNIL